MAKRSKFFCIAVEGATCDGRTLDRGALQEMADSYDPKTYTARVNMEHIRGFSADPPFNAYGDVVALETREVELQLGGKAEKKLGLFAQVDALDNLAAIQAKGQKLFSSIELNPNFAATGKAYLQGLAVTDSPASLGTEIMEFAAGQVSAGKPSLFAERKVEKGNFFSAAREIEGLEFDEAAPAETESSKLFAGLTKFFENFGAKSDEDEEPKTPPVQPSPTPTPTPANDNFAALMGQGFAQMAAAVEKQGQEIRSDFSKLQADHDTLKASIENTEKPGSPRRPAATGGSGNYSRTDC
ncbi:MAG: GPO family capsid scaffolding protein [Alphaproteobacteria bacterium]|nr:GPO family capsid scaffolding protein [Alphaproteobacteria bacterium]